MENNEKKFLVDEVEPRVVKCVLVGDGGVGKTSLLVSYLTNGFPNNYIPTAFDDYSVSVKIDRVPYTLQFCDTAGQEEFDVLRQLCYPATDVFIVCFSVVSPTSFANVGDKWLPEIRRYSRKVPIVLVGTHCDLRTDVQELIRLSDIGLEPITRQKAENLAKRKGIECYIETSAVTQKNMKSVFDEAIINGLRPPTTSRRSDLKGCVCSVM